MANLEVGINRGSQLQFYQAMWGPLYEAVLNILGSTGVILPIGDPKHGQPNATTFTTVGEEQVTFTWSEAPNSFDTKLDLTDPASYQGIIPVLSFNGSDEEADSPDAAFWTRASNPFSIGVWFRTDDVGSNHRFIGKDDAVDREWLFQLNTGNPYLQLNDDSAGVAIFRPSATAVAVDTWYFSVATHDGATGGSAADTINIYLDGALDNGSATNDASYAGMEDLPGLVAFGVANSATPTNFWNGKMAGGPLGLFFTQTELSADAVKRLYEVGRRALAL